MYEDTTGYSLRIDFTYNSLYSEHYLLSKYIRCTCISFYCARIILGAPRLETYVTVDIDDKIRLFHNIDETISWLRNDKKPKDVQDPRPKDAPDTVRAAFCRSPQKRPLKTRHLPGEQKT